MPNFTGYKRIILTKGKQTIVDVEDFNFLNQWKWSFAPIGYAIRYIGGGRKRPKYIYMHQLLMKTPNRMETDHINRDRLDNRKSNLRIVTHQQNQFNKKQKNNSSNYKGVVKTSVGKGYMARIIKDNKSFYLGYFQSSEEAAMAYDKKAKELFGEFAYLNFGYAL